MSIQVLYQADVLLDGVAGSTEFCKIKLTLNQPVKDVTTFGDTARKNIPSLYDAQADGDFYYQTGSSGNMTQNEVEGNVRGPSATPFTPNILTLAPDLTVGNLAYIWKGVYSNLAFGGDIGEPNKASLTTKAAYRNVQGSRLIRAASAITGTSGLGTSVQLGAASATQAVYAALHVITTTGGAAGTVFTIISSASSGMGAPTTRLTFATGTSAVAGEWQETAVGAITDTWYAFKWAGYTGTGCTVSATAGIQ